MKSRILLMGVAFLLASFTISGQNTAPRIEKFDVIQKEQGEQGVVQTVVRGVADDAEEGMRLNYTYRIVSGSGYLEPVKRYAILHQEKEEQVVIELKVTDSKGLSVTKELTYTPVSNDPRNIYLDAVSWKAAIGKNFIKNPAFKFQQRDPNLPNVLLIGNSISIGYTPYVQKLLAGTCNVNRIPANGGDTNKCIRSFELWMGDNQWDVIHFNFGMHDFKRLVNNALDIRGAHVVSPRAYKENLEAIVALLKTTGAKLIWASISVVPEGADGRIKGEEVTYNKIALEVMEKHEDIIIDDQYALTSKYPEDQRPANVHFLESGKERQAKQVVEHVLEVLQN